MDIYQGKGVFPGVAFGAVSLLLRQRTATDAALTEDPAAEWERFTAARREADAQLEALYLKTKAEVGADEADIIDVQRMMLDDGDFNDAVEEMILQKHHNAPYAVSEAGKAFSAMFAQLEDAYMKNRAADVADAAQRLIDVMLGRGAAPHMTGPVVVVAEDLTPSETLQLDKTHIRAFVIQKGSTNSHTAILARVLNIPCIVQANIPLDPAMAGQALAVDGETGLCYLRPDEPTQAGLLEKQKREQAQKALLDSMRGLPTITGDGRTVRLFSNIGGEEDLDAVLENDAEGVGLFRSEFLYLGRTDYPSEDELFEAYRRVAEGLGGRQVIIRTLDIGADKKVDYFDLAAEENPALGLRGVRLCLERPALFKTQLRAIYRASAFGSVGIMFPMIASLWEVRRCKELAAEVRSELTAEGVAIGEVELGIMVETPAAVVTANQLAREVDFFSVGTNDLTQYTLAVDRQNEKLDAYSDPRHPAVLAMLQMVAKAARKHRIWAGVCGELAADPAMTETLVDMGYNELSVSPPHTLELRRRIRAIGTVKPKEGSNA